MSAKKYAVSNIKTLRRYIEMLSGNESRVDVKVENLDRNTFIVSSNTENFSMLAISWCNYANCLGDQKYILKCKSIENNKVEIKAMADGSIERCICHRENGVTLFKVFKNTKTEDGKYKKRVLGYGVERVDIDPISRQYRKVKCCYGAKGIAQKVYKEQVRGNSWLVGIVGKENIDKYLNNESDLDNIGNLG